MLDHPDFNDIAVDTYKQKPVLPFMLTDGVYITRTFN